MKPAGNALGSLKHLERGVHHLRPDSVTRVKRDSIGQRLDDWFSSFKLVMAITATTAQVVPF
jgi:hypothetical protein